MRDRSTEFNKTPSVSSPRQRSTSNLVQQQQQQQDPQQFFEVVKEIQQQIRQIQSNSKELQKLHRQLLNAVREQDRSRFQNAMDKLQQETNQLTRTVRRTLQQQVVDQMQPGRSDYQMMRSQQLAVANRFRDAVVALHDVQMAIQNSEKEQLERQLRIVNPSATDEDIRTMVDNQQSGPVFSQRILESSRRQDAQRVLSEVQDRHEHVVQLAKSIVELQTLFEDMSTMIDQQDAAVMQVASQVDDVEANTRQANTELTKAIAHAKSARKRKWCIIIFLLCLFLGVGTYVTIAYILPAVNKEPAATPAPAPAPAAKTSGK